MDTKTIKESILRIVETEVDLWLVDEPTFTDPIEYEKSLLERSLRIGKAMLEQSHGMLYKDRNRKKKF